MTIKPLRSIDDHDIVPFFALDRTGLKGQLVSIVSSSSGYYSTQQLGLFSNLSTFPNVAYSPRWEVKSKVTPTASGTKPFGITLFDTRSTNEWSEQYIYDPIRAKERQICLSGEGVPIARKGEFLYGPLPTGTNPAVNSYLVCNVAGDIAFSTLPTGTWQTINGTGIPYNLPTFGQTLGVKDENGYVVIDLNCY